MRERQLPTAFLRRCIELKLKDPAKEDLVRIGRAHFPKLNSALLEKVATLIMEQSAATDVPSVAEYLDTVRACDELKIELENSHLWDNLSKITLWKHGRKQRGASVSFRHINSPVDLVRALEILQPGDHSAFQSIAELLGYEVGPEVRPPPPKPMVHASPSRGLEKPVNGAADIKFVHLMAAPPARKPIPSQLSYVTESDQTAPGWLNTAPHLDAPQTANITAPTTNGAAPAHGLDPRNPQRRVVHAWDLWVKSIWIGSLTRSAGPGP